MGRSDAETSVMETQSTDELQAHSLEAETVDHRITETAFRQKHHERSERAEIITYKITETFVQGNTLHRTHTHTHTRARAQSSLL